MKAWLRTRKRPLVWSCLVIVLAGIIANGWTIEKEWPSPDGRMTVRTYEPCLSLLLSFINRPSTNAVLVSNIRKAAPQLIFQESAPPFDEGFPELDGVLWQADSQGVLVIHHGQIVSYVTAWKASGPDGQFRQTLDRSWIDAVIRQNLLSRDPGKRRIAETSMDGHYRDGYVRSE